MTNSHHGSTWRVNTKRLCIYRSTIILLLFALAACTTMQAVKQQEGLLTDYLVIGDHIIVYATDGRIVDMRFVLVEGDVLRGSLFDDGLEPVEIKLEHIEKIEAERIAFGKSTAAVLGGIVLAPLAAVGAGLALAGQ